MLVRPLAAEDPRHAEAGGAVERLRPVLPGEFDWMAVRWPEPDAFLKTYFV